MSETEGMRVWQSTSDDDTFRVALDLPGGPLVFKIFELSKPNATVASVKSWSGTSLDKVSSYWKMEEVKDHSELDPQLLKAIKQSAINHIQQLDAAAARLASV
jgi:hypothetical protein